MQASIAFGLLIVGIIGYSVIRAWSIQLSEFLYNNKKTRALSTFPSVVAGNIGAGTIYGLYTFGGSRPLLAVSIALSYAMGLVITAFLVPLIRSASAHVAEPSLVGFIAERHGVDRQHVWIAWLAIAGVFVVQLAVELLAVGDVVNYVFGLSKLGGTLLSALIVGSYLIVGGYKSATVSAHIQAPLVFGLVLLIGGAIFVDSSNMLEIERRLSIPRDFVEPVGALFLIAPAVFLSIDNWHRVVAAESTKAARRGFIVGSMACAVSYLAVTSAGILKGEFLSPTAGLMSFLPATLEWIVPVIIAIAIFSVMDSAVPPLVAGMPGSNRSLGVARFYTLALMVVVLVIALMFGGILQGIIAAFSSLAVFLPATVSALLCKRNAPSTVLLGIPMSVVVAVVLAVYLREYALPFSILVSLVLYLGFSVIDRIIREKGRSVGHRSR
jgi:Na+/proline symporter